VINSHQNRDQQPPKQRPTATKTEIKRNHKAAGPPRYGERKWEYWDFSLHVAQSLHKDLGRTSILKGDEKVSSL
jgi:hypothetical protein